MFNTIKVIKEELFDAPVAVKAAFNKVCEYFALTGVDIRTVLDELVNTGVIMDYNFVESTNSYKLAVKGADYNIFVMPVPGADMFAVYPYPIDMANADKYFGKLNSSICRLSGIDDAVKKIKDTMK